jgi:1-aminocyclopropane-1-carboxylate deaminase|tara:strand:- start:4171 stop:5067 length:897 start_codon:yes stop_codon:yes gene_type:complete
VLELNPPPIDKIDCDLLTRNEIVLRVLRLDKIHPHIHGNKWFKLKNNLAEIKRLKATQVLSFGGAFSNHLYALAAAGKYFGFATIGVIRGELREPLNPILQFSRDHGMRLVAVSRKQYRDKNSDQFLKQLTSKYGESYYIPEGGGNYVAVQGCQDIAEYVEWLSGSGGKYLAMACGTGTTMAGLITGLKAPETPVKVLGISVLKAEGFLEREVHSWVEDIGSEQTVTWEILQDYHCGGYAKSNDKLKRFISQFTCWSNIPIEPIYTGKLFYGLFDQISNGKFPKGSEILAIHSGGVIA